MRDVGEQDSAFFHVLVLAEARATHSIHVMEQCLSGMTTLPVDCANLHVHDGHLVLMAKCKRRRSDCVASSSACICAVQHVHANNFVCIYFAH